jgi:hypothetical protein
MRVQRCKTPDGELVPEGMCGELIAYSRNEAYPAVSVATILWDNGVERKAVAGCVQTLPTPLHEAMA